MNIFYILICLDVAYIFNIYCINNESSLLTNLYRILDELRVNLIMSILSYL